MTEKSSHSTAEGRGCELSYLVQLQMNRGNIRTWNCVFRSCGKDDKGDCVKM